MEQFLQGSVSARLRNKLLTKEDVLSKDAVPKWLGPKNLEYQKQLPFSDPSP